MVFTRMRSILGVPALLFLGALPVSGGCDDAPSATVLTIDFRSETQDGVEIGLPHLPPAVSTEDVRALVEGFSWNATTPLPELDDEGNPTLYYARIYVKSREEIAALDQAYIQASTMPLLSSERAQWSGMKGRMQSPSDGRGILLFSVIPGRIYNIVREQALLGDPLFEAIEIVELPEEARTTKGSFSYAGLRAAGFRFRGIDFARPQDPDVGRSQQPVVLLAAREVLKLAAEAADELNRLIAKAAGNRDRNGWFGWGAAGSANIFFQTDLRETDPAFGGVLPPTGSSTPDLSQPVRRAWGDTAGQVVKLPGVRISVWSQGDATVAWLATLFEGTTNGNGEATVTVAKNRTVEALCVAVENDAAEVTEFLTEAEVCDFKAFSQGTMDDLEALTWVTIRIQDEYFNVLAQATESKKYLEQVVGYSPHKVDVLVGPIANTLGYVNGGAAFAPCLGFPNLSADFLVAGIVALVALVNQPAAVYLGTIGPILAVDVVLPGGGDNLRSHGVMTHEYGHFATCSILFDDDPTSISTVWTNAVIDRLGGGEDASNHAGYTVEAVADFFSAQVVGGTNYFSCGFGHQQAISYCKATNEPPAGAPAPIDECLERNDSATGTFEGQTARVATTMHDAFDGHLIWNAGGEADKPSNADMWVENASGLFVFSWDNHDCQAYDETVALPGSAFYDVVARLDGFGQNRLLYSLADTMFDHGYDWCEICDVFAIHDASLAGVPNPSPLDRYTACAAAPIASWLGMAPNNQLPGSCNFAGCPDGTIPDYLGNACVACAPGQVEVDGWECQSCPTGAVVIDNQCRYCQPGAPPDQCTTACPGRTELQNGVCVECDWAEVSIDGVCQPCPEGQVRQDNTCVVTCTPCGDETVVQDGVCVCIIN
jgi:hypothetical protein